MRIASSFGLFRFYKCEIRLRAIHLLDDNEMLNKIASNLTAHTTGPYKEMEAHCREAACAKLGHHLTDQCSCTRCRGIFHDSVAGTCRMGLTFEKPTSSMVLPGSGVTVTSGAKSFMASRYACLSQLGNVSNRKDTARYIR